MKIDITKSINQFKEQNIVTKITVLAVIVSFLFSLIMYFVTDFSQRRVYFYENLDKSGLWVENRYFSRNKYIDNVELFVSEFLLGPISERYKNCFSLGTKLNSCIVRNKTLYVDLSKEALFTDDNTSKLWDGTEIFKKNVFRNFRNIDIIKIYIEGREIFNEKKR